MAVLLKKIPDFNARDNMQGTDAGWLHLQRNVELALGLYKSHTYSSHLDMVDTEQFVTMLCRTSWNSKKALRQMLRQSKYWSEDLQSCIIPSKRVLTTNPYAVYSLCTFLFADANLSCEAVSHISEWLVDDYSVMTEQEFIDWWNSLYPHTIHKGAKKTRVLRKMLIQCKVWSDKANSPCQEWFSKICDELNPKTEDITYYLSINPAHILTQSNPKQDNRGDMLTSCHSLDNSEHEYNNGCSGYAMDKVTMILFQAATPDADGRCTRKTMRQFFMYEPGSGILLQSRMYDSHGGTRGHQKTSEQTLSIIQGIINDCEAVDLNWKTYDYSHSLSARVRFDADPAFGGYTDWYYTQFNPHISCREGAKYTDSKVFTVGTAGICLACGAETEPGDGIYCHYCSPHDVCDECGESVYSDDDLTWVYDRQGNHIRVCEYCLDDHYRYCEDCEEYHHVDKMYETIDGDLVCDGCFNEYYTRCEECNRAVRNRDVYYVTRNGYDTCVCNDCLEENYVELWDGSYIHYNDSYHDCPGCGELVAGSDESEPCGNCEREMEEGAE